MNEQLLRRRMKSNLLFLFIAFFCISYNKRGYADLTISPNIHNIREKLSVPVLEDMYVYDNKNKVIGLVDSEITATMTSIAAMPLHTLNTFNLNATVILLRSPVSKIQLDNNIMLQQDYDILVDNHLTYLTITIQNRFSANYYVIYIRENKNKQLEIFKETMWDSVVATIAIGQNDYSGYRANLICYRENINAIKATINIPDDFNFNNEKDCFTCPLKYSFEECLHKKQLGENFL